MEPMFSTRSGESQPVLPLSDSDQDRTPCNQDQTIRTRILNPLAAGLKKLTNLFLIPLRLLRARRKKPSGGGSSGFSAILMFLLSFIASCGFSAIPKVHLSLIPSDGGGSGEGGGGGGSGEGGGGGCGGISAILKVFLFFIAIFPVLWVRIIIKLYYLGLSLIDFIFIS